MKRFFIVIPALAAFLFASCSSDLEQVTQPAAEEKTELTEDDCFVPGEIIVELSDELVAQVEMDLAKGRFLETKSSAANSVFRSIGAISVERLYSDAGEWEPRHREAGLHRWYRVKYDPNYPRTKAVTSLDEIPGILSAAPERRIKPTAVFNDPDLRKQWHYYNDGTLTASHKKGCDINVLPVWERYTGGKNTVIVSVVDGGVDPNHEDLAGVVLPGGSNGSKNFVTGGYTIVPHSHGTHVGGTIGAINNNGVGCCGIAGGLNGKGGVMLMSCQVFQDNPEDPDHDLSGNFYDAMVWGADHGAVISQNSWGHVYASEKDALENGSVGYIKGAIDYFIKYAGIDANGNQTGPMKGGVVIFAAGNDEWSIGWPAAYDKVIAVGAVAPDFTRAYYSNYGDWVDLAAPGGSVHYSNGQVYSTVPGNKYSSFQGTSMACPHVSGVAALLVSYFGGPGFTNEMLKQRLLAGANSKVLPASSTIGPLVDAFGAFATGSTKPPKAVTDYTVSVHSNFVDFAWTVTSDPDDYKAYAYMLLASKDRSKLEGIDMLAVPEGVSQIEVPVGSIKINAPIEGTLPGLEFVQDYFVTLVACDYSRNYSEIAPIKQVKTGTNTAPAINPKQSGSVVLKAHEVVNLDYDIFDPDGHAINVGFTPGSAAAESKQMPDGSYRIVVTAKNADTGKYTAEYKVTDEFGAVTVETIDYEILENHAPVVKSAPENQLFTEFAQKKTFDMDLYFNDPDGEQLKYEIATSPVGIVHLNQVENVLNLTTLDYGVANVIITGVDVRGEKVSVDMRVLVRDPNSDPDVYPTQVKDYLNVSDGMEKELKVTVSSAAGAAISNTSAKCDAFNPIKIDMRGYAPGSYAVEVVSEGKVHKTLIVKL